MDKFMNNHWVIRGLALLLALMLYMSVSIESNTPNTTNSSFTVGKENMETVLNVPVTTYYDSENLVISGVPQNVTLMLEGPTSISKPTKLQREFEIFVDLSDYSLGTHQVPLKFKGISEKLEVNIEPAFATVLVQEKVSKTYSVNVDFLNKDKMDSGLEIGEVSISPRKVTITGAKEEVEKVAIIKAIFDLENVTETTTRETKVTVYDREGNSLPMIIQPAYVNVTLPVQKPNKEVTIKPRLDGQISNNYAIQNVTVEPSKVTIFANQEVLDGIGDELEVPVDINQISEDTDVEITLPLLEGYSAISPDKIKVSIDVEKKETRLFSNIPITIIGMRENFEIEFKKPDDGRIDMTVLGAPAVINNVQVFDLKPYINVADLEPGSHTINIYNVNPLNVETELELNNVEITISKK